MSLFVPRRIATPETKAGPIGSGASVLLTERALGLLGTQVSPQKRIKRAWQMASTVAWIGIAEDTVDGEFAGVPWHLEDADAQEITDETGSPAALAFRDLMEHPVGNLPDAERRDADPGTPSTRNDLWWMTCRHMGLCGMAFWYLDALNAYGVPNSILYLRPDRLTPVDDAAGNLVGWILDKGSGHELPLKPNEVLAFPLRPPDDGHYPVGLVDLALQKAQIAGGLDHHLEMVLQSGGRLSGILAPTAADHLTEPQFSQLVRDFQTITDQPEAAKRLQIVRGPVEFTKTTLTPEELALVELMDANKADLLTIWGVPLSALASTSEGLNSGDSKRYEDAAFWKHAVHRRVVSFRERIQFNLLSRLKAAGTALTLVIEEPEFDERAPKFDLAVKAVSQPLKNRERRELMGFEPFGESVIGESGKPLDEEVWLPAMTVLAYSGAEGADNAPKIPPALRPFTGLPPTPEPPPATDGAPAAPKPVAASGREPSSAPAAGGAASADLGKAKPLTGAARSMRTVRERIDRAITPKIEAAAATVLAEQRAEVGRRVRANAEHLAAKPADTSVWWDAPKWDRRLAEALRPQLAAVTATVAGQVAELFPPAAKAGPAPQPARSAAAATAAAVAGRVAIGALLGAEERAPEFTANLVAKVLDHAAARVTAINETTRKALADLIAKGVAAGDSPGALGDRIEAATEFDEYRSELIGRTELASAYNEAALGSYRDVGIEWVEAIDGIGDDECAARNGRAFPIDEATQEDDHPNGTLDWVPMLAPPPGEEDEGKATLDPMSAIAAAMSAIASRDPAPVQVSVNVPEQPAPIVNVAPAQVDIHLPPASAPQIRVEVPTQPAPIVQVEIPAPVSKPTHKTVVRDALGRITEVREEPAG